MTETTRHIPVYTAAAPPVPASDELRARIPGWGVDLDHAVRPAWPKERPEPTGAHWDLPERQEERQPRERSIEHQMLPPVFGTVAPLHGLSGVIRRRAYERYSEARAAHWLLLMAADRVDAVENHLRSFASLRPDNPIATTGVRTEPRHGADRLGTTRADLKHQWMDPLIVAGPWAAAAGLGVLVVRAARKR